MPTLYASGIEGDFDWLAISLLGPSLDSLYRKSGMSTMDLRSVCCIAMQMVRGFRQELGSCRAHCLFSDL